MASAAKRVYWIQGLRDGQWQNLRHCDSQEDAVVLLGEFVARDKFEELRLSEAAPSKDGGEPIYTEIALMRDGKLVDRADERGGSAPAQATSVIDQARREPRLNAPLKVESSAQVPAVRSAPEPPTPSNSAPTSAPGVEPQPPQPKQAEATKPTHPFGAPDAPTPVNTRIAAQREPSLRTPAPAATETPAQPPDHRSGHTASPATDQLAAMRYGDKQVPVGNGNSHRATSFEDALRITHNDHDRYRQANLPGFERNPPRRKFGGIWLTLVLASAIVAGVVISTQDPKFAQKLFASVKSTFVVEQAPPKISIFEAVKADDTKTLNNLLRGGANPNARDDGGTPLLLLAARHHALDAVKSLLRAGAKPTNSGPGGVSVLHNAAAEGLSAAVRQMIDAGTSVNLADGTGKCSTPLQLAASNGHLRTVQLLLGRDASLDPPAGRTRGVLDQKNIRPAIRLALERAFSGRLAESQRAGERSRKLGLSNTSKVQDPHRPVPQDPDAFQQDLFAAMDAGDLERIRHMLANRPEFIQLDAISKFVSDDFTTGYRSAVDYALLARKKPIATVLMNAGMVPSVRLLHHAIDNRKKERMKAVASFLIENGVDMNSRYQGLTALMRAAHAGDRDLVSQMLSHGADPTRRARGGKTAAEFAAIGGDKGLHELLVVRAEAQKYTDIMLGFSWFDDFDKVRSKAKNCRDMGSRYVVCTVKTTAWLQDVESVEAQFDRRANNRLVALEIKSKPIPDRTSGGDEARRRFEQVLRSIKSRLPKDHIGIATRQAPAGVPFWEGLKPSVKAGEYHAYWSDDDKRRPIFGYLKLLGSDKKEGRYKIVIGNPFRIG
ncbi:MAG TPA: hypothetical protein DCS82_07060 [Rhodospirillaceae bacterium]|nr:hypothetical protein [Rhodospirillaceae bacterium]HAT35457.1 hypothetical protein [Rhodospirillaceae bacterium]